MVVEEVFTVDLVGLFVIGLFVLMMLKFFTARAIRTRPPVAPVDVAPRPEPDVDAFEWDEAGEFDAVDGEAVPGEALQSRHIPSAYVRLPQESERMALLVRSTDRSFLDVLRVSLEAEGHPRLPDGRHGPRRLHAHAADAARAGE
ncbi:MAG: hypothetical protein ACFCVE_01620 [Phycisphaerae bacterium]